MRLRSPNAWWIWIFKGLCCGKICAGFEGPSNFGRNKLDNETDNFEKTIERMMDLFVNIFLKVLVMVVGYGICGSKNADNDDA